MPTPDLATGLYFLGSIAFGGFIGWLLTNWRTGRNQNFLDKQWRQKFEDVADTNQQLSVTVNSMENTLTNEKALVKQHSNAADEGRIEIKSLQVKIDRLSKEVFMVGTERDELKSQNARVAQQQQIIQTAKQRIVELQTEFRKGQEFYQAQADAASEERGVFERRIEHARLEQNSLGKQLASAKTEYDMLNSLLASTKIKLQNQDVLEKSVASLKADKVQLLHKLVLASQETKVLSRDIDELGSLKAQNSQLVRCLESMDESRKQYEVDARRYRQQVQSSETESDTLRFKMEDLESKFMAMRQADNEAAGSSNGYSSDSIETDFEVVEGNQDDLQEIVGVGEAFESALHKLGIHSFRQIAAFGTADIARVNAAIKELNGRIEHDDWIGQAKELHFQKYHEA
jgi:predicted flap endonuclease-1-like 5' DNA nuclease